MGKPRLGPATQLRRYLGRRQGPGMQLLYHHGRHPGPVTRLRRCHDTEEEDLLPLYRM